MIFRKPSVSGTAFIVTYVLDWDQQSYYCTHWDNEVRMWEERWNREIPASFFDWLPEQ